MRLLTGLWENIIANGAYKSILRGLLATVEITAAALMLGCAVGITLLLMSRSRFKLIRALSSCYIFLVRGTPVTMLIMLLFYVVFSQTSLDAMVIAFLGFGMNTGAYMGEIFKSAVNSVDPWQVKAALTLGFNKYGVYRFVVFPQAMRFAKPVVRSTVVSLIQWTSVVSYITITDITRAVNSMGARTAKPFYAMAVGIALYLLLACAAEALFKIGRRRKRP